MLVLLLGATTLPYLLLAATPSRRETLVQTPLIFLYDQMNVSLAISRVFIGFFLIILTAYVIGQEFQFGTVRILLARGLGRVQLLLAKFCAVVLVALALIIISILLHLLPASSHPHSIGISPLVPVDGPHTLWVALVYSVIFAVAALVLTWKWDVKE